MLRQALPKLNKLLLINDSSSSSSSSKDKRALLNIKAVWAQSMKTQWTKKKSLKMTSVVVYIPARCVCAELMWTDPNSPVILVDLYCGLTVKWCKRYARYYEHYTDTVRDKNTNSCHSGYLFKAAQNGNCTRACVAALCGSWVLLLNKLPQIKSTLNSLMHTIIWYITS